MVCAVNLECSKTRASGNCPQTKNHTSIIVISTILTQILKNNYRTLCNEGNYVH